MNNHKSPVSRFLIYLHAFLLACGNDTLSYIILNITVLDSILVIYFLLNINSISNTIKLNNIFFIILALFVGISIYSTILNSVFENTLPKENLSFLRYISYFFILITYSDFLITTKKYGEVFIFFLFGIFFVVLFDIYFLTTYAEYNFFENYGRYLFGEKYFTDEYCFNNFFCYSAINVNNLSSYLSIGSALIITFIINDKLNLISINQKIILALIFLIFLYISIGFGQKTAFFPYLAIILFSFIYFVVNLKPKVLKFFLFFFVIIILTLIIFPEILNLIFNTINDRTFRAGALESSWTTRIAFALKAVSILDFKSLLFGLGKNSYYYATGYNDPHNFNAQIILETGIFGLFLYLSILYYIFQHSFNYSYFLGFLSLINYTILSNANGLAFQSHTAFIVFTFFITLGITANNEINKKKV